MGEKREGGLGAVGRHCTQSLLLFSAQPLAKWIMAGSHIVTCAMYLRLLPPPPPTPLSTHFHNDINTLRLRHTASRTCRTTITPASHVLCPPPDRRPGSCLSWVTLRRVEFWLSFGRVRLSWVVNSLATPCEGLLFNVCNLNCLI